MDPFPPVCGEGMAAGERILVFMKRDDFEKLVMRALGKLPAQFLERLQNVEIMVESRPGPRDLASAGLGPGETLFGLYHGIPLPLRDSGYSMTMPDRIVIYQNPLENECTSDEELFMEVQYTLFHEVGHYFGLSEEELGRLHRRHFGS